MVATVVKGRKIAEGVNAIIVPGSGVVKALAEEELDKVFLEAGLNGASRVVHVSAMNADWLEPVNGALRPRTVTSKAVRAVADGLISSAQMAAAAAVAGHLTDVRDLPN